MTDKTRPWPGEEGDSGTIHVTMPWRAVGEKQMAMGVGQHRKRMSWRFTVRPASARYRRDRENLGDPRPRSDLFPWCGSSSGPCRLPRFGFVRYAVPSVRVSATAPQSGRRTEKGRGMEGGGGGEGERTREILVAQGDPLRLLGQWWFQASLTDSYQRSTGCFPGEARCSWTSRGSPG